VWSAWPDAARIYLGGGLLLAQRGRGPATALHPPPGLALPDRLELLAPLLPRGTRLQVDLGAALCPAVALHYPQGLSGLAERLAIAQAGCADALGLPADEVLCNIDARRPAVAAGMARAVRADLAHWAATHGLRLRGLRPLWSAVSAHAATADVAAAPARALVLDEADATTVLGLSANGEGPVGFSLTVAAGEASPGPRMLASLRLDAATACHLRLCAMAGEPAQAAPFTPSAPALWRGHWHSLAVLP